MLTTEGFTRSFGRTASRMSLETQEKLDTRLACYAFSVEDVQAFAEVEIEVGMGNGLAMLERAKLNPNRIYVGIEVYKNGLRSLVNQLEQAEKAGKPVKNVRIVSDDARTFLESLPKHSVDRMTVLYPDPWPKKKHNKRRIFQGALLDMAERIIKDDGELFAATDIPDYAFWMIKEVYQNPHFQPQAVQPSEWVSAPVWWVSTKYEQKAFREGRFPWYLTFKKVQKELAKEKE